jgi:hypothetical protein
VKLNHSLTTFEVEGVGAIPFVLINLRPLKHLKVRKKSVIEIKIATIVIYCLKAAVFLRTTLH